MAPSTRIRSAEADPGALCTACKRQEDGIHWSMAGAAKIGAAAWQASSLVVALDHQTDWLPRPVGLRVAAVRAVEGEDAVARALVDEEGTLVHGHIRYLTDDT